MTVTASELRREPWTIEALAALPDNGNRYEIIEGQLIVSPMPAKPHLRAVTRLHRMLIQQAPSGVAVGQNAGVYRRTPDSYLVPDLWVADEALLDDDDIGFRAGEVGLAVEVISPNSRSYDLVTKRHHYATLGIPHYWIVDSKDACVRVLRLAGDTYRDELIVRAGEPWRTEEPFPLVLDPAEFC